MTRGGTAQGKAAHDLEALSWRTLSVRKRLVEELSGAVRGSGVGRARGLETLSLETLSVG